MESPQNQIWGPALWMILHSATERIGLLSLTRLPQEESRIWLGLLSSLRYSLPCPLCKKHFSSYFSSASLPAFSKETIRRWLFDLHEKVNLYTNKPYPKGEPLERPYTITIEQLPEIYGPPFNFTHHYMILLKHMGYAIRKGICNREDVHRTSRFLEELKRFYDFF